MSLKIAFQMDPIAPINIDADSTFRIAEEAQARGHGLFYYNFRYPRIPRLTQIR